MKTISLKSTACVPRILASLLIMSTADIQKMTTHERSATMEQLWAALCHEKVEPATPAWHEAVLARRKAKLNSAEARLFTLEQIRDQFR